MLADVAAVAALVAVAGSVGAPATATNPAALTGFILLWLVLLIATRAYDTAPDLGLGDRSRSVLRAAAALGLICWIAPALSGIDVSAEFLVLLTGVLGALALLVRIAVLAWSSRIVAAAGGVPLVVAGDAEDVARVVAELHRVGDGRWRVVAARVPEQSVGVVIDAPVEVGIDGLADVVVESGAEAVLLLPSRRLDPFRVRRLAWELEATGARLYVGTGLLDAVPGRTRLLALGDLDLVHLRPAQMRCSARLVKAVLERLAVVVLLLILAPLLAAVAVAIRLDSKGPVFYNQGRVGRDGRGFTMYKFRTMTDGADRAVAELAELNDSDGQVLFKIREDPRVTRVGGLLRRYSLDELPQLFNVLRGNMSLVGPRPALPCEVALYDLDPRRRLAVTPGMTGLWQVSGRSDLSWEDTVRLDLHYVDNWSLALDAGILCRTVRAVLGHRGAY
jgi:exopolysaccharide biosynthesis polyprenyl glycosylphosphotransferase